MTYEDWKKAHYPDEVQKKSDEMFESFVQSTNGKGPRMQMVTIDTEIAVIEEYLATGKLYLPEKSKLKVFAYYLKAYRKAIVDTLKEKDKQEEFRNQIILLLVGTVFGAVLGLIL